MIHEFSAITNTYVSVPVDMGHFNCAAFLAGIIAGVLDSAKFVRCILSLISIVLLFYCYPYHVLMLLYNMLFYYYLYAVYNDHATTGVLLLLLYCQNAKVSAHNVAGADGLSDRTVFLIKFTPEVSSGCYMVVVVVVVSVMLL